MSYEQLLDRVPVRPVNVFPMYRDGITAEDFAAVYNVLLKEMLGSDGRMDLILLGMGQDGHTASLFPGTEALDETENWVTAYYLEQQQMYRITLTAPFLNRARKLLVISFGETKAEALKEVIEGPYNPRIYPAQLLAPSQGELLFLVDKKAAKYLHGTI